MHTHEYAIDGKVGVFFEIPNAQDITGRRTHFKGFKLLQDMHYQSIITQMTDRFVTVKPFKFDFYLRRVPLSGSMKTFLNLYLNLNLAATVSH